MHFSYESRATCRVALAGLRLASEHPPRDVPVVDREELFGSGERAVIVVTVKTRLREECEDLGIVRVSGREGPELLGVFSWVFRHVHDERCGLADSCVLRPERRGVEPRVIVMFARLRRRVGERPEGEAELSGGEPPIERDGFLERVDGRVGRSSAPRLQGLSVERRSIRVRRHRRIARCARSARGRRSRRRGRRGCGLMRGEDTCGDRATSDDDGRGDPRPRPHRSLLGRRRGRDDGVSCRRAFGLL